jgi:hypothetical protein
MRPRRHQQTGEREMAKMVRAEHAFEPVPCRCPDRLQPKPGVVQQHVDVGQGACHPFGEGPNARQARHIDQRHHRIAFGHPGPDGIAPGLVPHRQNHLGALRGQSHRRLGADAAAGSGDDRNPPGLVRYIPAGPTRHASALQAMSFWSPA